MKRLELQLTDEVYAALAAASAERKIGPLVEDWLWARREIRAAAKKLGLERKPRPKRGRPWRYPD